MFFASPFGFSHALKRCPKGINLNVFSLRVFVVDERASNECDFNAFPYYPSFIF